MEQFFHQNLTKRIKYFLFVLLTGFTVFGIIIFLLEGEIKFQNMLMKLNDGEPTLRYVIDTPGCKIPYFDPSPPSLREYFVQDNKTICSDDPTLRVTSSRSNVLFFYPENIPSMKLLNSTMKKMLIDLRKSSSVNESHKTLKSILNNANVSCCYQVILKHPLDFFYKLSKECHEITKYETVIKEHDAIYVICSSNIKEGSIKKSYKNVHLLVQDKRKNNEKNKSESEFLKMRRNKLSVIMFGTDSVSRLNFLRTQPKTYQYLTKELKAFEYKGYNKVGENTFPNVVALMGGELWGEDFAQRCFKMSVDHADRLKFPFDDCPFIWKDFQRAGYMTALVEDKSNIGTFTYARAGFNNQPTDHYTRPGFLAARDFGLENEACLGKKYSHEIVQSYSYDFEATYLNGLTFSLIWSSGLTHDHLNGGVHTDVLNIKYLKSLKEGGILNKSILFYMSDHGMRFGNFRHTDLGKYEDNLPYLFIVVPEWFRKSFPVASKNLQENTLKFFTPLDVHETLKDILNEKYKDTNYLFKNLRESNKSISLFKRLPITRTCTEIGMPLQYCSCQKHVQLKDTGGMFKQIEYSLLSYLNNKLRYFPKCSKIESLEVKKAFKSLEETTYSGTVDLVSVQALYNPGNASIETTLMWDKTNENFPFTVSGDISRINKYGNQSKCVADSEILKICVCKDII